MGKVTSERSQVETSSELPLFVKSDLSLSSNFSDRDMVGWNSNSGSDFVLEIEDTYTWEESPLSYSSMKKPTLTDPTDSGLGSAESLSPLSSELNLNSDMNMEHMKSDHLIESTNEPSSVLLNMLGIIDNRDSWSIDEPPAKLSRKDDSVDFSSFSKSTSSNSSHQDLFSKSLRNLIDAADNFCSVKRTQKKCLNKRLASSKNYNESSDMSSNVIPSFTEEATLGEHELQNGKDNLEHLQSTLKAIFRGVGQATSGENSEKHCIGSAVQSQSSNTRTFSHENRQASTVTMPLFTRKLTSSASFTRKNVSVKRPTLCASFPSRRKDGSLELRILSQPEEQHRARYLTEGSRGAIKDRRGTGFPTVKLYGYNKPVTLQVFIGTDQGRIQPHLFYQASQVCGKNSTPCVQKKIDGATVLEITMLPDKDMTVSCDCVGILKERNVDVEQRLLKFGGTKSKKRSTRCRIIFRVSVPVQENVVETLQVASASILCTQPPGIPEICRASLSSCSVKGEAEVFIIGKNFLKDTKVVVREIAKDPPKNDSGSPGDISWEAEVEPEKEYLQPTHLICWMPPYCKLDVVVPVKVQLFVQSGDKLSEPYPFTYVPLPSAMIQQNVSVLPQELPVGVAATAVEINQQFAQSGTVPTIIQLPVLTTSIPKTLPSTQDLIVVPSTSSNVIPPGHTSSSTFQTELSVMNGTETLGGHTNHTQLQLIVVQPPASLPPAATVTTAITTAKSTSSIVKSRKKQITDTALPTSTVNHSPILFDDNIPICTTGHSNAAKEIADESLQKVNQMTIEQCNRFISKQDCKTSINLDNHRMQNIEKNSSILMSEWGGVTNSSNSLNSNIAISCDKNESKSQTPFLDFSSDTKDQESYTTQTLRDLLLQGKSNSTNSSLTSNGVSMTETPSLHSDNSLVLGSNQITNSITIGEESKVPENDSSLSHFSPKTTNILENPYHQYSSSSRKEDCDGKIYSFDQENTAFLSSVTKMCFNKENKSVNNNSILNETIFHSLSDSTGECEQNIGERRTLNLQNPSSVSLVPNFMSPGKEIQTEANISIGIQNVSCESVSAEVKDSTFPILKKEAKSLAGGNQEMSDLQSSVDHINAMTMLPEMELLSIINPSTFDNV